MSKFPETKSNSRTGSGGPRTPDGKARSSQNAAKHRIFIGRILPEEKKQAAALYHAFQQELNPQGLMESEIVGDIVLNRLQKYRIDKYLANEFKKADTHGFWNSLEKKERSSARAWIQYRFTDSVTPGADCDRLPPAFCIEILRTLQERIKQRGPLLDQDLATLKRVYGTELTEYGAMMLCRYNEMKVAQDESAEDNKTRELEEFQKEILGDLETEIKRRQGELELKTSLDNMECASDVPVPPPAPVLDLILRYSAANHRELVNRLLALERIRRLRAGM